MKQSLKTRRFIREQARVLLGTKKLAGFPNWIRATSWNVQNCAVETLVLQPPCSVPSWKLARASWDVLQSQEGQRSSTRRSLRTLPETLVSILHEQAIPMPLSAEGLLPRIFAWALLSSGLFRPSGWAFPASLRSWFCSWFQSRWSKATTLPPWR